MPAAEAARGEVADADSEVAHPSQQVVEAIRSDPGLTDALRPVYIDYLLKHPDA